jgi:hypothetical protein
MRLPFFLLGVAVVLLVAAVGVWRLERFLASEPLPGPAVPSPGERAPLHGCTNGRLDRSRPRAWSLMDEAEVYSTIIRSELMPRLTRDLRPLPMPDRILVHPHIADVRPWRGDGRWSMTFACEQLPRLLVATAASFRMANRSDGERIYHFIAVPVPVAYARPTRDALLALEGTPGYLRFSRAGFSDDVQQALVYLERTIAYGFVEGAFYLLERQDGAWRVVERQVAWMT